MKTGVFTPALCFMLKYFFDIEKEITQQILLSAYLKVGECKGAVAHLREALQQNIF
jgi:hypothetical protein